MHTQTNPVPAKAQAPKAPKNKGMVSAGKGSPATLAVPPTVAPTATLPAGNGNAAFAAMVATQQKHAASAASAALASAARATMPNTGVAVQQAAKAGFTRTVQNGRGNYTPNSIGALIWQTANSLQALTPNTPVQARAVRIALPHVKPASVSAGLSHWRKFNGNMRVKRQARVAAQVVPTGPGPAALAWVP